jgi:hypothetical protein
VKSGQIYSRGRGISFNFSICAKSQSLPKTALSRNG